jgi:hypothetical protein
VFTRILLGYDRDAECSTGTPCTVDFDVCDDGTTTCANENDCLGIGDGMCNANPCAPPNDICGVKVHSLTPDAPVGQTIWGLVCDPDGGGACQVGTGLPRDSVSWDFSGIHPATLSDLKRTATTTTPINADETPNWEACGFNPGNAFPQRTLGREDKGYAAAPHIPTLNSFERGDDEIWMRGAIRFEGVNGALGEGESHVCYFGGGRTEVPLFRFPNADAGGSYMDMGDTWTHTPFACEPNIVHPATVHVKPCNSPNGTFAGTQSGAIVNEGVVKLPSGHRLRTLVVRSTVEYCVYLGSTCFVKIDEVRTVLYLWQAPHLGTVVRLQSNKIALSTPPGPPHVQGFTHLSEIDVKYGPLPPLSVTVGAVTGDSVALSWDPGAITEHIDGFRIYWDTESGGQCSTGGEDCNADHPGAGYCTAGQVCCPTPGDVCDGYDFDSASHPGQVTFGAGTPPTSATIDGLDPGTTYRFTVTAVSNFTDPATSDVTTYESLLYPARLPAVPQDLPVEVSATTTGGGGPAGAVPDGDERPGPQLLVGKGAGNEIDLVWGDSCLAGDTEYGVYEGALGSYASHLPVTCMTGGATNHSFVPSGGHRFYVVVPSNGSFEGSYGLSSAGAERAASAAACEPQSLGAPVCP